MFSADKTNAIVLYFLKALPYFYDNGQITALAVSNSTSVRVTWKAWNPAIDHGIGPVAHYKVSYWKANSTISSADFQNTTQTFMTITDLSPQTMYTFAVAVVKTYQSQLLEGPGSISTSAFTGCVGRCNTSKAHKTNK